MSKAKQGDNNEANVSMSRTRVKPIGRNDTLQWSDIPEDQQHLYLQIGKRLYNKGGLSPEQLRKFDTPAVGTDGAPACAITPFAVGGNVRILRDGGSGTQS